jgi:hypothetical protein
VGSMHSGREYSSYPLARQLGGFPGVSHAILSIAWHSGWTPGVLGKTSPTLTFFSWDPLQTGKTWKDLTKVDLLLVRSATDDHDVARRHPNLPLRSVPNIRSRQATCAAPLPTMSACPFPAPSSQAAAT